MVYLKFVLNDKRPKEDNIYPVVIRVTYNRNNTSISTGVRVKLDDWDKSSNQVKRGCFGQKQTDGRQQQTR